MADVRHTFGIGSMADVRHTFGVGRAIATLRNAFGVGSMADVRHTFGVGRAIATLRNAPTLPRAPPAGPFAYNSIFRPDPFKTTFPKISKTIFGPRNMGFDISTHWERIVS